MAKLPADPGDYWCTHPECDIVELAELYAGREGCSYSNLKKRKQKENWDARRESMREAIKKRVDEKLIEAKSDEIANQLKEVGSLFGWMLKNIKNDMPNMGATVQDGEGFPNKYHLETWKQGLAAYLKPKEDKDGASDAPSGIDIYPDAPPD